MIDEEKVIQYYLFPHPLKETCKYFHIGENRLKEILNKNNIKPRTCGDMNKKYSYNKDFFINQSANLAYVLGLMGADGCIAQNTNQIYIELQQQDAEILDKIVEKLKLTRPVKYYTTKTGYKNAKIYIEDKWLKNVLITRWGLCPNKTYNIDNFHFPTKLDKKYWKDYIRGYFDGDGCIKDSNQTITFQIDGSNKKILETMKNYLESILDIKMQIEIKQPKENRLTNKDLTIPLYRLYCYGNNARQIFNFIYSSNMELFLNRKYQKFIQYKEKNGI